MRPSKFTVRVLLGLFVLVCVHTLWALAKALGWNPDQYLSGLILHLLSPELIQLLAILLITGTVWATADYFVYRRRVPAAPIDLVEFGDLAKRWFGWTFSEGEFMDFMAGLRNAHANREITIEGRAGCVGDMPRTAMLMRLHREIPRDHFDHAWISVPQFFDGTDVNARTCTYDPGGTMPDEQRYGDLRLTSKEAGLRWLETAHRLKGQFHAADAADDAARRAFREAFDRAHQNTED